MKKIYAILLLAALMAGCIKNSHNTGVAVIKISTIGKESEENVNATGITAIELLREKHEVKTNYGDYVECIDGVCAEKDYMWTFYLNTEKSTVGASEYIVNNNDLIEWRFDKKWD